MPQANGANEVSLRVPNQEITGLHQKTQEQIQRAEAEFAKLTASE